MKKLILILTLVHSAYCCVSGGIFKSVDTIDHSNENIYTWLVAVSNSQKEYFALTYGSLVHPKAVLTVDESIKSNPTKNMFVMKNCDIDDSEEVKLFKCSKRIVSKIVYPEDQQASQNAWVLLILEKPYDMTSTTAPINLIKDINTVDTEHCFFTRWMRVEVKATEETGLIIQPYEITFNETEFLPDDIHLENLKDDRDWIVGKKFHQDMLFRDDSRVSLNFLGSPLSCPFKNDSQKFGLVGIATFRFLIPYREDDHRPLERFGSFVHILDAYDNIMKMLNENAQKVLCFRKKGLEMELSARVWQRNLFFLHRNSFNIKIIDIMNINMQTGLIIEPYYIKFVNEEFKPEDLHPENLKEDRDWVVGPEIHIALLFNGLIETFIPLDFTGSPFSCALKDNNKKYALVGIGAFRFAIPFEKNNTESVRRQGSYIKIIDSYNEIMTKLNENL